MEKKPEQVFISYCGDDADAAMRLCAILEDRGLACWIAPRNIPPGEEWPTAIPAAIKRSASMVLLLSSHTGASRQISREVEIADHNFVRVINFRLENVKPPESLEYFLTNRQWIDGFGVHFNSGVETLANALRNTAAPIAPALPPPVRQKRSHYWKLGWSLSIAFVLALSFQALEYFGWFAGPDGRLLNSVLTGRVKPVAAADEAVTILEIDNEAFQSKACFNGASPLSPPLVMGLVKESLALGPRVIGVDIYTEGDQYREMHFTATDPTVIWMSGAESSIVQVATLLQWLRGDQDHIVVKPTNVVGYAPGEWAGRRDIHWGVPAFPQDDDFTIRRFPRRIQVSADPASSGNRQSFPSWAAQVAQEYCRGGAECIGEAADEVYVSYKGKKPDELRMSDYFTCGPGPKLTLRPEKATDFRERMHDKALLIGGAFRPAGGGDGDFHQTPEGLLAGVVINAYAVRAEIEGSGLHDVRQPWALALDFAVGVFIVLIFHHPLFEAVIGGKRLAWLKDYEFRCMMGASLLLLAVLYAIVRWWLPGASYLAGFTAVGLGVLLHQMIEVSWSNPKSRE